MPSASACSNTSVVPMLRARLATSWLWVSRVRTLSLGSRGKTCVLSCSRRTGVEKRMRSWSRSCSTRCSPGLRGFALPRLFRRPSLRSFAQSIRSTNSISLKRPGGSPVQVQDILSTGNPPGPFRSRPAPMPPSSRQAPDFSTARCGWLRRGWHRQRRCQEGERRLPAGRPCPDRPPHSLAGNPIAANEVIASAR